MSAAAKQGVERRKSRRRPIVETFSLFLVVPKKGIHRLNIHDVSEQGIRFDLDTEGEDPSSFPLKEGESLDIQFYLNQSLYLPLSIQIARIESRGEVRQVGAVLKDPKSKGYQSYQAFIQMLDQLVDAVQIS